MAALGITWSTQQDAALAAAWCDRCPAVTECLLVALRYDAAHRDGRDPHGITGVCGGVWFEPGTPPQRVPHGPVVAP